jgi:hypothetical protein
VKARRAELEAELQEELAAVSARFDAAAEPLETVAVKPRKADIEVRRVLLAWIPS